MARMGNGSMNSPVVVDASLSFVGYADIEIYYAGGDPALTNQHLQYIKKAIADATTTIEEVQFLNMTAFGSKDMDFSALFKGCEKLSYVVLPSALSSINFNMESIFEDCKALQSIKWSGINRPNITNLKGAFKNCTSLKSVTFSSTN